MKRRVRECIFGCCAAVETVIRTPRPNLVKSHEKARSASGNRLTGAILKAYRQTIGLVFPAKAARVYTDVRLPKRKKNAALTAAIL